jgi:hypothetical protein
VSPRDATVAVRSFPRRYRALLSGFGTDDDDPDAAIRRRPGPATWSALEYTAHFADVLDAYGAAVRRIVVEDDPALSWPDPEPRVAERNFNAMNRAEVLGWLDLVCAHLAELLEGVRADDWTRTGRIDGEEHSALQLVREAAHQGAHHLRDVERVLSRVRGRPPA